METLIRVLRGPFGCARVVGRRPSRSIQLNPPHEEELDHRDERKKCRPPAPACCIQTKIVCADGEARPVTDGGGGFAAL